MNDCEKIVPARPYLTANEDRRSATLGLIACIMYDSRVASEAAHEGVTNDVVSPELAGLYALVSGRAINGEPVDAITITRILQSSAPFAIPLLAEASQMPAGASYSRQYISELLASNARVRILEASKAVLSSMDQDPVSVATEYARALISSQSAIMSQSEHASLSIDAMLASVKSRVFHGVPSRWASVNKVLGGGYQYGLITTYAAYRGVGKSTVALNEAVNAAMHLNVPTCVLSYEMTSEQMLKKMACDVAEVPFSAIATFAYTEEQLSRFENATRRIANSPLWLVSRHSPPAEDIVPMIRSMNGKYGVRLFIIDYIQRIRSRKYRDSRNAEIEHYMNSLSDAARECDVAIILMSQIARVAERENRKPRLSDIKDSGSIEQQSAYVCVISESDVCADCFDWEWLKCRFGMQMGFVMLRFGDYCRWGELSSVVHAIREADEIDASDAAPDE